jgi:hypothetical protein
MNKKLIDRLAVESLVYVNTGLDDGQELIFSKEKFAELIVRECMAMCKTAVGNADYNTGRLHCLNNIKEHFGVKS